MSLTCPEWTDKNQFTHMSNIHTHTHNPIHSHISAKTHTHTHTHTNPPTRNSHVLHKPTHSHNLRGHMMGTHNYPSNNSLTYPAERTDGQILSTIY